MEKKIIRAALLGLGTVGTGVYKVLKEQKEEMLPKLGSQIEIKKILVRNLEKAAAKVDNPAVLTNQWEDIVNDPEIDIVIELIGGIEPAKSYILGALNAGKHVVSANKDLIAVYGKELLDAAEANHVDFLFEITTRKYTTLLAKEMDKKEIQEGLIKACDVIDLIIEILRGSKNREQV